MPSVTKTSPNCYQFINPITKRKLSKSQSLTSIFVAGIFCYTAYKLYKKKCYKHAIQKIPSETVSKETYKATIHSPLPDAIKKRIIGKSYTDDCPVPLKDLAYIQLNHYNMQGRVCMGELIYHKNLALEIVGIFKELFEIQFLIEKMVLIDNYNAEDEPSMEDNNTSAFCSRAITGKPGTFSKHSYGGTIDLNPLINPYVKKVGNTTILLPKNAGEYTDRSITHPGMIKKGDKVYQIFIKRGYEWGGDWTRLKDYQHFEKDPSKFISNNLH